MSLADKLNYLKQTKNLIKTAINNKGGTLNTDSSFRSYAGAIDDIGSDLTAEAEDILAGKTALSNDGIITGTSDKNASLGTTYSNYAYTSVGYLPPVLLNLEKIDLTGFNTSSTTSLEYFFAGCYSLKSITNFPTFSETSNFSSTKYMFFVCTKLTEIPQLTGTSNVTNATEMFRGCNSLVTIPLFDTSSVTDMTNMFYGCNSLVSLPSFVTSGTTSIKQTFYNCSALQNLPVLNLSNVTSQTNVQNAFYGCTSLSNDSLNNILRMCADSGITAGGNRKLSYIGLTATQRTTCQSLSNYTDFVNAGWSAS